MHWIMNPKRRPKLQAYVNFYEDSSRICVDQNIFPKEIELVSLPLGKSAKFHVSSTGPRSVYDSYKICVSCISLDTNCLLLLVDFVEWNLIVYGLLYNCDIFLAYP